MKIVLATGIYPPDIGGPATYVRALARVLTQRGVEITVISYGDGISDEMDECWRVIRVSKRWPIIRWWRYARVLRRLSFDVDSVLAFSSVSAGVPLWLARVKQPKILRLGGDFLWERYTDHGGSMSLRRWYGSWRSCLSRAITARLLRIFDHIVFSTTFQQDLYERFYPMLPEHRVIENALPEGSPRPHQLHQPIRLLFLGRFVGFKNLPSLIQAMTDLPDVVLTLTGDGPLLGLLQQMVQRLRLSHRVRFELPVHGQRAQDIFNDHDILILPSLTEISPNTALEARSAGLPVLLTEETGLSAALRQGMVIASLADPGEIVRAIRTMVAGYEASTLAQISLSVRSWDTVGEEYLRLLRTKQSHSLRTHS